MSLKKLNRTLSTIIGTFFLVLLVLAILEQLRLPSDQRTWQGRILGIPYDLRLPTPERLRDVLWNEQSSQVIVPRTFGIGWTVNFYPLLHPTQAH